MNRFYIKEYAGNLRALVMEKDQEPKVKGLPPTYSSCIMFEQTELCELIKVLKEYADKTGNT